jgi:putative ABC transport system permease protein
MRSILVAGQVALSLVLLVSAGLLLKSFILLQNVDPGFDPNHVGMTFIYPPRLQNASIEQQQAFFRVVLTRISSLRGIESAGIASGVPDSGDFDSVTASIRGRAFTAGQRPILDRFIVSPGYFATLRIPLIKGRLFNDVDDPAHPLVVIVNQLLADRLFPREDPIGQRVQIPTPGDLPEGEEPYRTIVGVVGNVVQNGLASQRTMEVYAPYSQYDCQRSNLFFRTSGDPLQLASAVRAELHNIDSTLLTPEFAPMEKVVAGSIVEQRFSATLLTMFGVSGLFLAAIGIYGVISYVVAQRTSEFGIRLALGGTPLSVLALVVRHGMRPVLIGAVVGMVACLPATRIIEHLLFKTGRLDIPTLIAVFAILIGVALAACFIPARRAMCVDPLQILRTE